MKHIITYSILFLLAYSLTAQNMEVDIRKYDYKTDSFEYSQFNLYFLGATVPYEMLPDSSYGVELLTTLILKQKDKIVHAERHRLRSNADFPTDFTDSYSFRMTPGEYDLVFRVQSSDSDSIIYTRKENIVVKDFGKPDLSDIMLLQSFKKARQEDTAFILRGVAVELLPFSYVPDEIDRLGYFLEYYPDSSASNIFLIEHIDKYNRETWQERIKKGTSLAGVQHITPMFKSMRIEDLESGQYRLVADLITRSMDTLATTSIRFIRANPDQDIKKQEEEYRKLGEVTFVDSLDAEELVYALKAIAPVIPSEKVPMLNYVLKQKKKQGMKAFLFNYWKNRAPLKTSFKYHKYMEVARAVDNMYNNGLGYGFETDMGRVFLRYGRPTQIISSEKEISAVPYVIWTYDYIPRTKQSNVKFVFYNPSLVTNGYELIHSTARGEIKNPRWELYIYSDAPSQIDGKNFLDSKGMKDNINRNARRYYEDN